jgi:WD40 repeat protein
VVALALSSDGKQLIGTTDTTGTSVWDVPTGTLLKKLDGQFNGWATFLPGGHVVATIVDDNTVRFWMLSNEREVAVVRMEGLAGIAVTGHGRILSVLDYDHAVVQLWDISNLVDPEAAICRLLGAPPDRSDWERNVPAGPAFKALC